jgi:HD-GYP domain-containing protein (c-di-GMP phosphodiesterase class II)/DNA-binding CsgD family transcriptional regulator
MPSAPSVRLAELLAALSLGIDLGFGQPMEHVLRQCVLALRMADKAGLDDDQKAAVYYTALLVNVGCHSDAHEQAKWFGDDIALKAAKYDHEQRGAQAAAAALSRIGSGNPPLHRLRVALEFALFGHREVDGMIARHAALACLLAEELGLPPAVREAVASSYERWDGRGWPGALKTEQVPIASRLSQFAEYVEVANRLGGVPAAVRLATDRAGAQFDPDLCELFCAHADEILQTTGTISTWDTVIAAEPALGIRLTQEEFQQSLRAIATFVDLKSPYMLGHAAAVEELVALAGERAALSGAELQTLKGAGLIHGLGRLGISNAIWDKKGPLGAGEWERVRLHPYLTERMLKQSAALAPLAAVAVQLRERLDGSGYPRGLPGAAISVSGRILGAADAYQSMREPRPHRPALTAGEAAAELRAEVEAVLAAAGHRVARRQVGVAGLTPREVEVLRLLARGLSSREIAARLVISHKTARNHIEHIYTKVGASGRVSASLFAVQRGLLPEEAQVLAGRT